MSQDTSNPHERRKHAAQACLPAASLWPRNSRSTKAPHPPTSILMVVPTPVMLSPVDALMSPYWLTMLYVFPRPRDHALAFDLDTLHASFCALIDHDFPLFLGRMHVHKSTGAVSIRPPSQNGAALNGIEFTKARSDMLTTAEAAETRPKDLMPSRGLSVMTLDRDLLRSVPLMAVKCTLLNDGGLVIGIDTSHAMMDAQGMATFMTTWGQHYRGVVPRTPICHDRQLMAATGAGAKYEHPEFYMTAPVPDATGSECVPKPSTQKMIRFSRATLDQLKTLASSGCTSTGVRFVSTLDALTALLTILITQARAATQSETRVTTVVNTRSRLVPPLPKTYEGNGFTFALSTHAAARELQAPLMAATLSAVAQRIRKSVNACDYAFLRDSVEYVAQQADWSGVVSKRASLFGSDLTFSSWIDLGMRDADFHAQHIYVGTGKPTIDGSVIFTEGARQGTIEAMIGLETEAMKRMEQLWKETSSAMELV